MAVFVSILFSIAVFALVLLAFFLLLFTKSGNDAEAQAMIDEMTKDWTAEDWLEYKRWGGEIS